MARAAFAALALAAYAAGLGSYPLLDPDEGRNAEVAREMAETNDYVLPTLNYLPYVDKPVLFFAAGALSIELFGANATAVRLPSLVFTLATAIAVMWFGGRLFDGGTGWRAAVIALSTPFALAYSRTVIFDATLTFFMVCALVGFHQAVEAADRERGAWWRILAWGATALGVLTKGPVALVFPLLVALPYAAWRRRLGALADPLACLLGVALVLPWVFAVSREVPGYLAYVIGTETGARLFGGGLGRREPFWYFLAITPSAALPWSLALAGALIATGRRRWQTLDPRYVLLALWIVAPLVFFSLSQSKRPQYVLPLIPAVGLLVAALWNDQRARLAGARTAGVGLALLGLSLLGARTGIAGLVPASASVAREIPFVAALLGAASALAGVAATTLARRPGASIAALAAPVLVIPLLSGDLMRAIGRERSAIGLAQAIDRAGLSAVEIVGIQAFPLSLPFYARRPITLSTDRAEELTSNYVTRHPEIFRRAGILRPADWWRQALTECTRPRLFVARSTDREVREVLDGGLPLIAETRKYAIYGPCGGPALAMER